MHDLMTKMALSKIAAAILAITAAAVVTACSGGPDRRATQAAAHAKAVAHQRATCQEDEPCWDCKTMGNRICGPATFNGVWVREVTDLGPMVCWQTISRGQVYLNLCRRA